MDSFEQKTVKALSEIPATTRMVGNYRGRDNQRALVDVGDGRIPADFAGYLPEINELVWVDFLDGRALLLGPSQFKPDRGTFVSSSGGIAQINTETGRVAATFPLGQAFAVGQLVKLMWQGGPHIVSVMSTTPVAPTAPDVPAQGVQERELTFTANDSGSYRSGWWTNDVWYAQNNTPGAWFYGSKIKDTLPDNAVIISVEMFLRVTRASGSAPQIGTHGFAGRPGGGFAISNKLTVPNVGAGFEGWVGNRDEDNRGAWRAFADFLKANDGGMGTDGAGLRVFAGINADGQSGALRIKARY